jgi:hypothetical protein
MGARERAELYGRLSPEARVIGWVKPGTGGRLGGALVYDRDIAPASDRVGRVTRVS